MKTSIAITFCLLATIPAAHAVNFVTVPDAKGAPIVNHTVDVDSIRKGDDGFVYFTEKNPMGQRDTAVHCGKRTWKSSGDKIVPGSYGALLADFVCSRVP